MRILLYCDHPTFASVLQQDLERYNGIDLNCAELSQPVPNLEEFDFVLFAPVLWRLEAGKEELEGKLGSWLDFGQKLVAAAQGSSCQLCLISSDVVFKPEMSFSATETSQINELKTPTNNSPLALDLLHLEKLCASLDKALIVRIPPCISAAPQGGLAQLQQQIANKENAQAFYYRGLQPLDDLARVILGVLLQVDSGAQAWGLYHYAGLGACSQEQLINRLANPALLPNLELAATPMPSEHLLANFGVHPRSWQEHLPQLLEELHAC